MGNVHSALDPVLGLCSSHYQGRGHQDNSQLMCICLLQLTQAANAADDEETVVEAFTTFTDLLENMQPFFNDQLPQLIEWSMAVVCDQNKSLVVRQSALQVCGCHACIKVPEGNVSNSPKSHTPQHTFQVLPTSKCI